MMSHSHDHHHDPVSTRRRFLALTGVGAVSVALAGIPTVTLAAVPTDRRLVVVILRGALDGLAAVIPHGDRAYAAARGSLAQPEPGAKDGPLALDRFFSLHGAMAPLMPLWRAKQLAVLHAVALPYRERSHFDAQNVLENGTTRPGAADGWLNRALGLMGPSATPVGMAVGQALPLILSGDTPVSTWTPEGRPATEALITQAARLYGHDPLFRQALEQAVLSRDMATTALAEVQKEVNQARVGRPRDQFAKLAVPVSRLLMRDQGARVAVLEMNGWDTHANQGAADGMLAQNLASLAEGLAAFARHLAPVWDRTAILVMTEFGRTVAVNGTRGTDHGTASMALALGGAIQGGQVIADWPGLQQDRLFQGRDLAPTMDMRSPIKTLLTDHLGLARADIDNRVLPASGAVPPIRDLVRRAA